MQHGENNVSPKKPMNDAPLVQIGQLVHQQAEENIRYWSGPSTDRVPVVIQDGRVNFRCLAEKCETPCCGPFAGLGQGLTPCFVSSFSDLYLLDEDVDRLIGAGRA